MIQYSKVWDEENILPWRTRFSTLDIVNFLKMYCRKVTKASQYTMQEDCLPFRDHGGYRDLKLYPVILPNTKKERKKIYILHNPLRLNKYETFGPKYLY